MSGGMRPPTSGGYQGTPSATSTPSTPAPSAYSGPFGGQSAAPSGAGTAAGQNWQAPVQQTPGMQGLLQMMYGGGGQQLPQQPAQQPIQNPPAGGITGNPGYATGAQPQLSGNYWNQVAQQLAGPRYTANPSTQQPGGVGSAAQMQANSSASNPYGIPSYLLGYGGYGL